MQSSKHGVLLHGLRRGVQPTGVDTIIDAAGVAKGSFYLHFPSKDDLVMASLEERRRSPLIGPPRARGNGGLTRPLSGGASV